MSFLDDVFGTDEEIEKRSDEKFARSIEKLKEMGFDMKKSTFIAPLMKAILSYDSTKEKHKRRNDKDPYGLR
jgi:hypothetical protein